MSPDSKSPSGMTKRAEPATFRARTLSASLTVNDIQKSLAWYRDVAAFTVDQQYEREGKLMAVSLKAGAVSILLTQDDGARGANRAKGEGFSLQFTTADNIDEVAQRIKSRGGKLATEPEDTRWGARVFRLQDPDGFKLVISSERADAR